MVTSFPVRLAGWAGDSILALLETLLPADGHESCVTCDAVTPKGVQPCTACFTAQCQLTDAEAESEDTPYCNGCGRPHGAGECLRDREREADVRAFGIAGLMGWMLEHRRTDARVQCGHCHEVVDSPRFATHLLTCELEVSAQDADRADVSPAISPAGGAGPEGLSHSPRDPSGPPP